MLSELPFIASIEDSNGVGLGCKSSCHMFPGYSSYVMHAAGGCIMTSIKDAKGLARLMSFDHVPEG